MISLNELLREPSLASMDVDGEERLHLHRDILHKKRMLREVFGEFIDCSGVWPIVP